MRTSSRVKPSTAATELSGYPDMIPPRTDPEALLIYARDWVDDANDRYDMGMKAMAQESLRTAAMMYVKLPPGVKDAEFEKYYEETSARIYS